jgi:hypothetical protein
MNEHRPEWYDRLKGPVFKEKTFTRELALKIEKAGFGGRRPARPGWLLPAAVVFCLLIVAVILAVNYGGKGLLPKKANPTPAPAQTSGPTGAPTPDTSATPAPTAGTTTQPTPGETQVPPPDSNQFSDVRILLTDEPGLGLGNLERSAIQVTAGEQEYALHFAEKMDRASVEATLKKKWNTSSYPTSVSSIPRFSFAWQSDTDVVLTVTAARGNNYRLDVREAKTAAGGRLAHVGVLDIVVSPAQQLRKVSLDGKSKEKLAELLEPYNLQPLDPTGHYYLASRNNRYCECDASYGKHYGIYDTSKGNLVKYLEDLSSSYIGPGDFTADTRGFFYAISGGGAPGSVSFTAFPVNVGGYVFGTGFTADRSLLLIATARDKDPAQTAFELIVYRVSNGVIERLPQALKGALPQSPLDDKYEPLQFTDAGDLVITNMHASKTAPGDYYAYNRKTGKVEVWKSPSGGALPIGFTTDGMYANYTDLSIYKGNQRVKGTDPVVGGGLWVPGTHRYLHIELVGVGNSYEMYLHDADTGKNSLLMKGLPSTIRLTGFTPDGKSAVMVSEGDW